MKHDTSWGKVADWYASYLQDPDNYQSQVILPNLVRAMDIKVGEKVLDVACGSGFFSEIFHGKGAHVTGVDISPELIAIAKKNASPDINFFVSEAHVLEKIESQSIDKVVIVLALQNIKEARETLQECSRVLKKSGSLYVVLNHPAFRIAGASSWQWDPASPAGFAGQDLKMFRRIDQYLSEKTSEISMHPGSKPDEKTVSFHRPLQYYMKAARSNGFVMTRLEEWISHKVSEPGPRQKEEDRMRKEIPLFMLLEYLKL